MVKRTLLLIPLVFLVQACSSASEGYVTGKKYEPAYTTTSFICASYDSKGICTVQMPVTNNHSECYRLNLKNDKGDKGSVCVSPAEYESYEKGNHYPDAR